MPTNIPPLPEQDYTFTSRWVKWLRKIKDAITSLENSVTTLESSSDDYYILGTNTYGGVGALAAITTGDENLALGTDAGAALTTSSLNTFIGYSNTSSADVIASTSVGHGANTNGNYAVAIGQGSDAGEHSVAVGHSSGAADTGSVAIGYQTTCDSNSIAIGYALDITGADDVIKIGDSSHTTVEIGPYDLSSLPTSGGSHYRGGTDTTEDIIIDSTTSGLVLLDTAGHYWRVKINTSGVLTTTDLGTTKP